jgi:hypothetical protein
MPNGIVCQNKAVDGIPRKDWYQSLHVNRNGRDDKGQSSGGTFDYVQAGMVAQI